MVDRLQPRWPQLSERLDELFDLAPAERAERLAEIDLEDREFADALRRLLAADAGASGLLDHGVAAAAPTVVSRLAGRDDARRGSAGRRFGHYILVERIGSGGMGEVWRGERGDGDFQQQVAIKLIAPGLLGDAAEQRFARERRILARLEHPAIARLLDGGVADDTPYYAMELVDGIPLTDHAQRHALSVRERVALLLQVCDAVAYAHAQLVVHRDLKPANILVDRGGRVRVLDFGIARLLDDSDVRITRTGVRVFSPAYAAPEQIRGEDVATSTDVYALGAVLYELLTGELPHPQRSASPDRLLATLDDEQLVRPSRRLRATGERSGARDVRTVDGDLDTVVVTALHADPHRRYPSALRLADDLRAWLDGRPIAARPDTARYRMRKFVSRHRLAVGSASAVLLALLAGLGIALWQGQVARAAAARADAEAERARQEAQRADRVKQFLGSIFVQVDPLRRDASGERTLAQAFDEAAQRIDSEFADDPVTRIDLLDDFGEIRAGQGDLDGAQALIARALALAEATYGEQHPAIAESALNLGVLATYRGRHVEGEAPLRRALAVLHALDEPPVPMLAAALSGLAGVLHATGRRDEALPLLRDIVELRRTHAPADRRMLAVALQNLAVGLLDRGEHEEAARYVAEARATIEAEHGVDSASMIPVLWLQEELDYVRGDLAAQAATLARAVELARRHLPGDHWWTAQSLADHGWALARDGDPAAGRARIDDAVAMFERLDSPLLATATRRAGQAAQRDGDLAAAQRAFTRTLDVCAEQPERRFNEACLATHGHLAEVTALLGDGDGDAALALADAGLAAVHAGQSEGSDAHAQVLQGRIAALDRLGRHAEAAAVRSERLGLLRALYGDAHPLVARLLADPAAAR